MKTLAVLGLVLALAGAASANEVDFSTTGPVTRAPRHKVISGRTLTIMGLTHLVIGAAIGFVDFAQGRKCSATPGCFNEGGSIGPGIAEAILISSGAVFVTAGAPMWAIGARDTKRLELQLSASGAQLRF